MTTTQPTNETKGETMKATELILRAEQLEKKATWNAFGERTPESHEAAILRQKAEHIRSNNFRNSIKGLPQ